MGYKIKTAATTYPITLEELKQHLRLPNAYVAEDAFLNFAIKVATAFAEKQTNRQLMSATWFLFLDEFPSGRNTILLNRTPIQTISSITYTDTAGESQTIDPDQYVLNNSEEPAILQPISGTTWPTAINQVASVCIEFVSGYTEAAKVPENTRMGMFLIAADLWANRETIVIGRSVNQIPRTAEHLFDLDRIFSYE